MQTPMNENQPPDATPDQLLRLLDVEIARQRGKRQIGAQSRIWFRAGALILIVGAMFAALALLQYLAADLPRQTPSGPPPETPPSAHFENF